MPIRLVVTDVDGTLVTPEKVLSPATLAAAHSLRAAGVHLAMVSSRPPRGMAFLAMELGLSGPFGGFNGATILAPDGAILEEHLVPEEAAQQTLALFASRGVEPWLFAGNEWLIKDFGGTRLPKEHRTVRFDPQVVEDFTPFLAQCGKIVGVSDDHAALAACEAELQAILGDTARASRSQPYYLDVNSPEADKGHALRRFATWFGVELADVCAIGDERNDLPMFRIAGRSVAMGNAPDAVAAGATHRTATNAEDGWAEAIRRHVLATA